MSGVKRCIATTDRANMVKDTLRRGFIPGVFRFKRLA